MKKHQSRYGVPGASYRLQLHAGFDFDAASRVVPYLCSLGITHLYVSPIFAAAPGSTHGYDVLDHGKVNPELGGLAGLYRLSETLTANEMGLIADIVPNHVGIANGVNPWWRSVLRYGQASPYADYFDIDWEAQPHLATGVLIYPVLGQPFGMALEAGEIRLVLEEGDIVLRYYEQNLPLRPESYARVIGLPPLGLDDLQDPSSPAVLATVVENLANADPGRSEAALARMRKVLSSEPKLAAFVQSSLDRLNGVPGNPASFDALEEIVRSQHYRLTDWRMAGAEINYRRFFDQNTLAAIRVERDDVFEDVHRLLFELVERGIVTGVRVDHIDGLYDPTAYLKRLNERLQAAASGYGQVPIFVEKILEGDERLPKIWPIAGATGYEALAHIERAFANPAAQREMTRTYDQFTGSRTRFETIRYESKRQVVRTQFAGEISVLAYQAHRIAQRHRLQRDNTLRALRNAIEAIMACFPVYRVYVAEPEAPGYIEAGIQEARRREPHLSRAAFDFLAEVLLSAGEHPGEDDAAQRIHFRRRLQQVTGPIMAKGLEDTAFFRYNRLLSLNEVGSDPTRWGETLDDLHAWLGRRASDWPGAMSASSTHDTKRSEDVRARINLLSELPREWRRQVGEWSRLNERHRSVVEGERAPDANLEYYIYQTLAGSWPEGGPDDEYRQRIREHITKAMREAKQQTSWITPNEPYEEAALAFTDAILRPRRAGAFIRRMDRFVRQIAPSARLNSYVMLVLKALTPGFPDFYQGTELLDLSLTDPDNRRPVDFELRKRLLRDAISEDGREVLQGPAGKLWLTAKLLYIRQQHREALCSGYQALAVSGERKSSLIAFSRGPSGELAVVVPRLVAGLLDASGSLPSGDWGDTTVELPPARGCWYNLLTGERHVGGPVHASELFAQIPLAVLSRR